MAPGSLHLMTEYKIFVIGFSSKLAPLESKVLTGVRTLILTPSQISDSDWFSYVTKNRSFALS